MNNYHAIPFSGNDEDWQSWRQTFLSQADMIGFADVMEGLESIPTDKESLDTENKIKNRMMKKTAFFALTASMESQTNKDIIF